MHLSSPCPCGVSMWGSRPFKFMFDFITKNMNFLNKLKNNNFKKRERERV